MEIKSSYDNKMPEDRDLLIVSDRGPVEYTQQPGGQIRVARGRGGLVTALSPVTRLENVSWIASAKSEYEHRAAQVTRSDNLPLMLSGHNLKLRFLSSPLNLYDKFYNVVCNRLWFLQHQMWNGALTIEEELIFRNAWEEGYMPFNQLFAEAAVQEARKKNKLPLIMVQDIHLYLTTALIRRRLPDAIIEHFVHIPWPTPEYWEYLPDYVRIPILEAILSANIVGLQTGSDVRNFFDCCRTFLPKVYTYHEDDEVTFGNHTTRVRAYPTSIDLETLRHANESPDMKRYEQTLLSLSSRKTLVRVDRVDPTKNIAQGFRAFSLLLEHNQDMVGKVSFLAFLVPAPLDIPEYRRCQEEIDREIQAVNSKFGRDDWQPITLFYEHNYQQALAGLRIYDALLVNSVADGMNLVAKEGPMVNTRSGVLILSISTGAFSQLEEGVVPIAHDSLEMTEKALYQALTMPRQEREHRLSVLRLAIEQEDANKWFARQLEDLRPLILQQQDY